MRTGSISESWNAVLGSPQHTNSFRRENKSKRLCQERRRACCTADVFRCLVASLGTPYEIQTDGTILLLEDINAKPYQVDRMLMQLKLAGKFDSVSRHAVRRDARLRAAVSGQDYRLQEIILSVLSRISDSDCVWIPVRPCAEE